MSKRSMNERIKISSIVDQVETGNAILAHCWPWRIVPNPAHKLFFQADEFYEEGITRMGWYFMRVWVTVDGKHGYLRDSKCEYDLDKDVPLQMLWEPLQEIYTMAKLADDPKIMGHPKVTLTSGYRDTHTFLHSLVYDERYPWQGYYSTERRHVVTLSQAMHERRMGS